MVLLRCIIAATALLAAPGAFSQELTALPDRRAALEGSALLKALRQGGYTVYLRHGATDNAQTDKEPPDFGNCATQRNLSEAGRAEARGIGEALAALKLPVSEVLASPYCRTMETARLAAGRADASREVLGGMANGKPDYAALDRMLATPPAAGTNRIVVGHANVFRALAGLPFLAEGEAAVIRPEGSRWVIVARMKLEDWKKLSR